MNARNLLGLLERSDASSPALVVPDGPVVTYGSLRQQIEALAGELAAAGVAPSDRVALVLPNGIEAIVMFLAAAIAGTAAPLNPAYRKDEFEFYLGDTGARAVVVTESGGGDARSAVARDVPIFEVEVDGSGTVRLRSTASGARRTAPDRAPEDVALVLHTSGTTSRPKRVPLTHGNLLRSAYNIAESYRLTPADVSLCVMPLFHVHGLIGSVLATFAGGGAVAVPGGFNKHAFWGQVRSARATWYSAVPTIHQMLLLGARAGRPSGAEQLRFIRSCSASLPPAVMADMEERFGVPVLEAYGMTEAAHQMATNPLPPSPRKPGSVGPGSNVEIGIMDKEGNLLAAGSQGEVVIRGSNVTPGYEDNPEANAASFTRGWFRTGDEGVLDADGYLKLIGRIKELIVRGGEKVSPREVDEVLALHPAVAEVATFGEAHPIYGEEVAAAVALRAPATAAEILAFCRERLAEFKCPKKIHILEKLPRTATGKIQRRAVAASLQSK